MSRKPHVVFTLFINETFTLVSSEKKILWKYMHVKQGFPNGVDLWWKQFGQNGQKLHENYKIKNLVQNSWETWGDKPIFRVVVDPPKRKPAKIYRLI